MKSVKSRSVFARTAKMKARAIVVSFLTAGTLLISSVVHAVTNANELSEDRIAPFETSEFLKAFHENPKRVLNLKPVQWNEKGFVANRATAFDVQSLGYQEAQEVRDQIRKKICEGSGKPCNELTPMEQALWSEIDENNLISNFLYTDNYLNKLADMEKRNLLSGAGPRTPWADSYWPMTYGITSWRYTSKELTTKDFVANDTNFHMGVGGGAMSPAEKYGALVADGGLLVENQWNEGRTSMKEFKKVPGWAGICHGWAAAAIHTPNPARAVTVQSPNGSPITFYPSDIKGLASLLYANAPPPIHFVGTRCKVRRPQEDEVGRVIRPDCLDVNPATWHIGTINHVGVDKRSYIFDGNYDLEVWNYPMTSYSYSYFNPQTMKTSRKLAGSVVAMKDFTIDKFKKYRSPKTKYAVGIVMDVNYVKEAYPSMSPINEDRFPKATIRYVYDLELDEKGVIIGGEWYTNFHPGFIWTIPADGQPMSIGEKELPAPVTWDGVGPVPTELRGASRRSSVNGQPLAAVVLALVRLAAPTPVPAPAGPAPQPPTPVHPPTF